MTEGGRRPRIVVAGGGFAGLWAVRRLAGEPVDVVLLDTNNYHTFVPLLYQVATADLGPAEVAYPIRSIFRGARNVEFRMAEVESLDPGRQEVVTDVERVPYDHLLLAIGSRSNFLGIEGAGEHSFPLKEMSEAIPLRHHIFSRFERAIYERDPERRRAQLTFTIVGGGPTGVEFAGALAELVHGPLRKDYPTLDMGEVRIVLLEAMDRLLLGMDPKLGAYARDRLERRGVEVRTGAFVSRVEADRVHLENGEPVDTGTIVWSAGVQGPEGPEAWGLPVGKGGKVEVEETLQVPGHPEILVAGDLAYMEQEGEPLPAVAPVAIQQGKHAGDNLARLAQGRPAVPFRFEDPGMLAVIGRNTAVAEVAGRSFTGFVAWVLWSAIHIAKLIGFRNRAMVLIQWAWNYFSGGRDVRLILPPARPLEPWLEPHPHASGPPPELKGREAASGKEGGEEEEAASGEEASSDQAPAPGRGAAPGKDAPPGGAAREEEEP